MKRVTSTKTNKTVTKTPSRFVIKNRTQNRTANATRVSIVKKQTKEQVLVLPKHSSVMARVTSLVLVSFFLLIPIGDAYADTIAVTDTSVLPTSEVPAVALVLPEVIPQTDTVVPVDTTIPVIATDATSTQTQTQTDPSIQIQAPTNVSTTTESTLATSSLHQNLTPVINDASSTPVVTHTATTTSDASTTTPVMLVAKPATTTPQVSVIPVLMATTTRIVPVVATVTPLQATATSTDALVLTHTTDADRLAFSTTECVPLGNGAFHCVRASDQATTNDSHGSLYSARDASSGDLEIYIKVNGKDVALTNNDYDDDAPTQDPISGDIVWHSLINDRYQVVEYDKASGAITRITKENYNSMQPAIYNGDIVFQSWIGNNWEIVLIDKTNGRVQLTTNDTHDIAPSISAEYIMWQSFENNAWVAKVYDRHTQKIETVKGLEGGKVENPRMVLVFDNKKENGDVETLGYDPASGVVSPLASEPAPLPPPIPVPQNQKEDKVLPQVSTTTRIETKFATTTGSGDGNGNNGNGDPLLDVVAPSTGATSTVAILATTTASVDTTASSTLTMTPLIEASTTPAIPKIPDLVVPLFNGTSDVASTTAQ